MHKPITLFTAVFVFLFVTCDCSGETLLFKEAVPTCSPVKVPIPAENITDAEWKKGEITFYITASNQQPAWTIYGMPEVMYLTDGVNKMPLKSPFNGHSGAIQPGHPLELTFALPPQGRQNGITLENTLGLYGFSAAPQGKYTLEVWKSRRAVLQSYVDPMNRCWFVDATAIGKEGIRFHYTCPDTPVFSTPLPTHRGRIKPEYKPFTVNVGIDLANGERLEGSVRITPHTQPLQPPLKPEDIQVGICYYSSEANAHTSPADNFGERQSQVRNVRDFIEQELGNLLVLWGEEDDFKEAKYGLLEEITQRNHSFMTIYRNDPPDVLARYRNIMKERFLENNIGEFASYLYQGAREAAACKVPVDYTDLRMARDRFVNQYIAPARKTYANYNFFFSTSGAALAHYELAGGVDFMCSELFALGAMNTGYATAEMRGAARRWKPEYWGGWLAHEWQTTAVPYTVPQKYDLLKVGLYQQYLMGTSVIVLESGADSTQAGKYTATQKDSEWGGKPAGKNYNYFGHGAAEYRRTMKEFYDFVRTHPRPADSPESKIALLLGNGDSWVGMFHSGFAVWAQHQTAEKNPLWRYGDPERTWQSAMNVFFPTPVDTVKPYSNNWVGGSPYGQTDVVGIDEEIRCGELSRYDFAAFAGWNSMVPELLPVLDDYVKNGGTLFLSVPHCSARFDREYKDYAVGDLIHSGNLTPLMNVQIEGRKPADAVLKAAEIPLKTALLGSDVSIATAKYGDGVQAVIETADGRPVLIRQSKGSGRVYLLLTWEYPGHSGIASLYQDILRHLAGGVKQEATIAALPDRERDVDYIAYAVYSEKVFFLNTDCVTARSVRVNIDGTSESLTLQPTEMHIIERIK
ncbi:MAG: hypothetical protein LBU65_09320 [Planctomycetaceae bacterium]|jgi:hypothetical protein|nr:hypothetical protein [Planctomycetaceae bacterium]